MALSIDEWIDQFCAQHGVSDIATLGRIRLLVAYPNQLDYGQDMLAETCRELPTDAARDDVRQLVQNTCAAYECP